MGWWCVYEDSTGAAVSFTSTEPDGLPAGLASAVIAGQPAAGEAWDPGSRDVVSYTPVPADPSGGLYEIPAWRWTYAVGPYRLAAKVAGVRSAQPSDASAQAYIKANVAADEVAAAISWATARRDSLGLALAAAGVDPDTNDTYVAAEGVLAFLGGCL